MVSQNFNQSELIVILQKDEAKYLLLILGTGPTIFVATGYGSMQTVEIINLDKSQSQNMNSKSCKKMLPNFPTVLHGAMGHLDNGDTPMICGGFSENFTSYRSECFILSDEGIWTSTTGNFQLN